MFKFLRRTSLYLLAIPALFFGLGIVSNQSVLIANHDTFPVRWNDYKVNEYLHDLERESQSKDKNVAQHAEFEITALENGFLDDTHVLMSDKTHLNALADTFALDDTSYSIGDALLYLGEWLFGLAPFVWGWDVTRKLMYKD